MAQNNIEQIELEEKNNNNDHQDIEQSDDEKPCSGEIKNNNTEKSNQQANSQEIQNELVQPDHASFIELYESLSNEKTLWAGTSENYAIIQKYHDLNPADLLNTVGDANRFQYVTLLLIGIYCFLISFPIFALPYLFKDPVFECRKNGGLHAEDDHRCDEDQGCMGGYQDEDQASSLTIKYHLYCHNAGTRDFIQFFFFALGGCITQFLCFLCDKIGRRMTFFIAMVMIVQGMISCCLGSDIRVITLGISVAWGGVDTFFSCTFVYLNEMFGSKLRSRCTALAFVCWSCGAITINVAAYIIPDANHMLQFMTIPICVLCPFVLFLKETPYYYLEKNQITNLARVLESIACFNRIDWEEKNLYKQIGIPDSVTIDGTMSLTIKTQKNLDTEKLGCLVRAKHTTADLLQIFADPVQRRQCYCFSAVMIFQYLIYDGTIIATQKIGLGNMYVNGVLLATCELLGYQVIIPFSHVTPRRKLNLYSIFFATVFGLLQLVISPTFLDFEFIKLTQTIISSFLIKQIICADYGLIFTYMSEVFKTNCRAAGCGIAVFCGRVVGALAPFIIDYLTKLNIHPMVGCSAIGIIVFPIALILPETLNKRLK